MDTKIKWNIKEIGRGVVKIETNQLSRIPSIEEYKEYIAKLLGINSGKEKLLDECYSPYIAENQLVYQETDICKVIFSGPNGDISVSINDFDKVFQDLKLDEKDSNQGINPENLEAIDAAIGELFERG